MEELQKRIALLASQLPPENDGELQSEKTCNAAKVKPHRPHEERVPLSKMRTSDTFGLIHTPVHNYHQIPEAREAVGKELDKLEKIPAWNVKQVREREYVKRESQRTGIPVHFAELMCLCFLKNAELEKALQKYKGRCVLRGDNIRDKDGVQTVFAEQGASASDLVAAKSFDAAARMPGMAGSAADCVSAYTQVKLEDMYRLLKLPKEKCPVIWIKIPKDRWPKEWHGKYKGPVVPSGWALYGHPLSGAVWERH